jgi:hypothetical protein
MKKETNFGKEELSNEVQKIILNPKPFLLHMQKYNKVLQINAKV